MEDALLSIIIVNFNSWDYLDQCLNSIFYKSNFGGDFEVIVVDNASKINKSEIIKKKFPAVRFIINSHNRGFACANNQGIKTAKGEYIMLLNPDAVLLEDSIDNLVRFLSQHEDAGIVGPKIYNSDGTFQPQCKRGFPTPLTTLSYFLRLDRLFPNNRILSHYLLRYLDENETNVVDSVSGACMLIRREVIEKVGLLDTDYFMYGEDLDYCYKVAKNGWKIYYVPTSEIIHHGGKSGSDSKSLEITFYFFQSAWVFFKKNLFTNYPLIVNFIVYLGIWTFFVIAISRKFLKRIFRRSAN